MSQVSQVSHPCPSQLPQLPPTLGWMRSVKKHAKSRCRNGVGRASIQNGVGRASIERRLGGPVSGPSGLGGPSPTRWVSKTQQKPTAATLSQFRRWMAAPKNLQNLHIFRRPAPAPQPAEHRPGQGDPYDPYDRMIRMIRMIRMTRQAWH